MNIILIREGAVIMRRANKRGNRPVICASYFVLSIVAGLRPCLCPKPWILLGYSWFFPDSESEPWILFSYSWFPVNWGPKAWILSSYSSFPAPLATTYAPPTTSAHFCPHHAMPSQSTALSQTKKPSKGRTFFNQQVLSR